LDLLDRPVRDAVSGLGGTLAVVVGRHLAAAGLLLDEDPVAALEHALVAKAKAGRLAEVREVVGVVAYEAGDFALARSELRAARRMTGRGDLVALLADCERGLGQPERALEVAASVDVRQLDPDVQIELAIVVSGARSDMGQQEAAVQALEIPLLRAGRTVAGQPRLWYAYAQALLAVNRNAEAAEFFRRVALVDVDGETDAADRAAELLR
jgi:hypothetical protein